jgi:hypothetical protein
MIRWIFSYSSFSTHTCASPSVNAGIMFDRRVDALFDAFDMTGNFNIGEVANNSHPITPLFAFEFFNGTGTAFPFDWGGVN